MRAVVALLAVALAACGSAPSEPQGDAAAPAAAAGALVPGTAELQAAFDASCPGQPKIASATCTALEDATEFKCSYTQDSGTPSETLIAADGDTFVLIDLPNNCQPAVKP